MTGVFFLNDMNMLSYFQNGVSAVFQESMLSDWFYDSSPY